jgi:lipoyl synthase
MSEVEAKGAQPSRESAAQPLQRRKPEWLKVRAPGGERYTKIKQTLRTLDLNTVCEEARCPNVGECWGAGTATVMVLGDVCTRGCRFCAVATGNPRGVTDPREPEHVARALNQLELSYAVITMVDRDDLVDGGAEHLAATVRAAKRLRPQLLVETLVGDFRGRFDAVDTVVEAEPDVFAHNIEVPRRLTPLIRDARCSYSLSLSVLERAKQQAPGRFTKSSIMVGLGETEAEVLEALSDLRGAGVDVVTLGQYLRPTPKHAAVARYVTPEEFALYEQAGNALGFEYVASGPLVRSSYHAAEAFVRARKGVPADSAATAPAAPAPHPVVQLITREQLVRREPSKHL